MQELFISEIQKISADGSICSKPYQDWTEKQCGFISPITKNLEKRVEIANVENAIFQIRECKSYEDHLVSLPAKNRFSVEITLKKPNELGFKKMSIPVWGLQDYLNSIFSMP